MYRRCVSLFVLFGFLASQLAMVPCAHGTTSVLNPQGDQLRPHFHWGGWDGGHAGHEHGEHGHRHSHHPPRDAAANRGDVSLGSICLDCFDHDADAIYITSEWRTVSPRSNLQDQASAAQDHFTPSTHPAWRMDPRAHLAVPYDWSPPDLVLSGSGLYLALGQLRI